MSWIGRFFHGETSQPIGWWLVSRHRESPRNRDYQNRYCRGQHESNPAFGRKLHAKEREQQMIWIFGHGILLEKIPFPEGMEGISDRGCKRKIQKMVGQFVKPLKSLFFFSCARPQTRALIDGRLVSHFLLCR
jgi:hypothetical protein